MVSGKHFIFLGIISLIMTSGCIPYHSRKIDLDKQSVAKNGGGIRSPQWFYAQEDARRAQLNDFIASRPFSRTRDYHLSPGDTVTVRVQSVDENQSTVRVEGDGKITLPLVRRISVAGLTASQAQEIITSAYKKFYLEPEVTLTIAEYHGLGISIVGNVDKPGTYYLNRDEFSLLEALGLAGGLKADSSDRLTLIPSPDGEGGSAGARAQLATPERMAADAITGTDSIARPFQLSAYHIYKEEITGDDATPPLNVSVRAGDTIIVPGLSKIYIQGEVAKPGSIALNERMTVMGAIAAAGGLSYSSNGTAEVSRLNPDGTSTATVLDLSEASQDPSLDIRLQSGDRVRLPSSTFNYGLYFLGELLGKFFHTGVFYQVNNN